MDGLRKESDSVVCLWLLEWQWVCTAYYSLLQRDGEQSRVPTHLVRLALWKITSVKSVQNLLVPRPLRTVLRRDGIKYVTECILERKKCGFNRLGFSFPKMSDVWED